MSMCVRAGAETNLYAHVSRSVIPIPIIESADVAAFPSFISHVCSFCLSSLISYRSYLIRLILFHPFISYPILSCPIQSYPVPWSVNTNQFQDFSSTIHVFICILHPQSRPVTMLGTLHQAHLGAAQVIGQTERARAVHPSFAVHKEFALLFGHRAGQIR